MWVFIPVIICGVNNCFFVCVVSIESAGQIPPEQLFPRAVNVLRDKVAAIRSDIEKYVIPSVRMDVDMANES